MPRLFTVQHATLKDSMGNPLVLGHQQVGNNHHAVLNSPGTGAELQFRVDQEGHITHQGMSSTKGLLTRKVVGAFTYALLKPLDQVEDHQIWSFQHVGPYTFVLLGDISDPNNTPLTYLNINRVSPEPMVPANVAMVTLLRPDQLPDLWSFVEIPE